MPGVFAGGDVPRAGYGYPRHCGRQARGGLIDKYLGGKGKLNKGTPIDIPDDFSDDEVVEHNRFQVEELDPERRKVRSTKWCGVSQTPGIGRCDALPALRQEVGDQNEKHHDQRKAIFCRRRLDDSGSRKAETESPYRACAILRAFPFRFLPHLRGRSRGRKNADALLQ